MRGIFEPAGNPLIDTSSVSVLFNRTDKSPADAVIVGSMLCTGIVTEKSQGNGKKSLWGFNLVKETHLQIILLLISG